MLAKMVLLEPSRKTRGGGRVTFLPRPREGLFSRRIRNTLCKSWKFSIGINRVYFFVCVISVTLEPSFFLIFGSHNFLLPFSFGKWIVTINICFLIVYDSS